jgi:uncharacterized membrane protein
MLSVVLWGTLLGGVAYSHIVFFPVYLSALPDSAAVVSGPYGLHEARFWMTIHPLLIVSLAVTLALNWRLRARRWLIVLSLALYLAVLVVTSVYFVPELIAFEGSPRSGLPAAEWQARADRWQRRSWTRGASLYVGMLPLLFALARPARAAEETLETAPARVTA